MLSFPLSPARGAQLLTRALRHLGDAPGHPFHGNQYKTGVLDGPSALDPSKSMLGVVGVQGNVTLRNPTDKFNDHTQLFGSMHAPSRRFSVSGSQVHWDEPPSADDYFAVDDALAGHGITASHTAGAYRSAVNPRTLDAWDNDDARFRAVAKRETAIHAVADAHLDKMTVAVRYAFARGRKALGKGNADAAAKAVKAALLDVLPKALLAIVADGGAVALKALPRLKAAEFDEAQHPRDERGRFGPGNGVGTDGLYDVTGFVGDARSITPILSMKLEANVLIKDLKNAILGRTSTIESQKRLDWLHGEISRLDKTGAKNLEQFRTAAAAAPKLKIQFDAKNPDAVTWAKAHAAELAKGISATTRDAIRAAVVRQQESGEESFDDIRQAVGDDVRASLIAKTETMTAANEGQRQAWDQAVEAGLLADDAKRVWIATPGCCDDCDELDESVTDLDGEYPDPGGDGPPLHPNCRCTEGIVG